MFSISFFERAREGARSGAGGWLVSGLLLALAGPAAAAPSWTDWADLALSSSVVLTGAVADVDRFSRRDAPDVPPGEVRALVRVDLRSALRSPVVLPAGAAWMWQGAADRRGRPPFGRDDLVFAFADLLSGGGRPEVQALQLVSDQGQQPWSEQADQWVRAILTEARRPGMADLMVTGIESGFRSEGDVPGAAISQFFLRTENGHPLVLVVRRRPGQQMPDVLASIGELIDNAEPVRPETLVWRALACGLPGQLPPDLATDLGLADDYLIARLRIGDCGRTLPQPLPHPSD